MLSKVEIIRDWLGHFFFQAGMVELAIEGRAGLGSCKTRAVRGSWTGRGRPRCFGRRGLLREYRLARSLAQRPSTATTTTTNTPPAAAAAAQGDVGLSFMGSEGSHTTILLGGGGHNGATRSRSAAAARYLSLTDMAPPRGARSQCHGRRCTRHGQASETTAPVGVSGRGANGCVRVESGCVVGARRGESSRCIMDPSIHPSVAVVARETASHPVDVVIHHPAHICSDNIQRPHPPPAVHPPPARRHGRRGAIVASLSAARMRPDGWKRKGKKRKEKKQQGWAPNTLIRT